MKKTRLIIASPNSIGNVGQLSVDLLLNSLGNSSIDRHIKSTLLLPLTGQPFTDIGDIVNDERKNKSKSGCLCSPLELWDIYPTTQTTITSTVACDEEWVNKVLQIRSIPVDSKQFANEIRDFILSSGFDQVVVLCGLSMVEMLTRGIHDSLDTTTTTTTRDTFTEKYVGSGELARVLKESIGARIFGVYCSEGDNIQDAIMLSMHVCRVFGWLEKEWKFPNSWNAMYGQSIPHSITT